MLDIDTIKAINEEEAQLVKEGAYNETPAQSLARLRKELETDFFSFDNTVY